MINILGIKFNEINKADLLIKIGDYLDSNKSHYIITPNPEIVLKARSQDEEYFHILNNADLSVVDGIGLKIAAFFSLKNVPRVTGADLVPDVLNLLCKRKVKTAVLNLENGLSTAVEINTEIKKCYPGIELLVLDCDKRGNNLDYKKLNAFAADFMFVNFGAPYQERFIFHNYKKLPGLKCAIGVGGAFDFFVGKVKRAPYFMRLSGIEWLWRLILKPQRIARTMNATLVFTYRFILWKFIYPFLYRPNVVVMLYRKVNGNYQLLIVKRTKKQNHWQLPQGGTDGEALEIAGVRELSEELNLLPSKLSYIASFKNLHKYLFYGSLDSSGVKSTEANGYKGQKQGLCIVKFLGRNEDIRLNYYDHNDWRWINAIELPKEVHECRKESSKKFLEKFDSIKDKL